MPCSECGRPSRGDRCDGCTTADEWFAKAPWMSVLMSVGSASAGWCALRERRWCDASNCFVLTLLMTFWAGLLLWLDHGRPYT